MNIRGRMLSITIASKVDQMDGGMVVLNSKQWWSLVAYLLHGHLNQFSSMHFLSLSH